MNGNYLYVSKGTPPIDVSTLMLFRKRLKPEVIMEANEYILAAMKEEKSKSEDKSASTIGYHI